MKFLLEQPSVENTETHPEEVVNFQTPVEDNDKSQHTWQQVAEDHSAVYLEQRKVTLT